MTRVVRWVLGVGGVLVGLFMFGLAVVVGDCAAFGGRCPSEGLQGDVMGMAGTGVAMAVGLPILAHGWSRRAVATGVVAGLVLGVPGGLLAGVITRS